MKQIRFGFDRIWRYINVLLITCFEKSVMILGHAKNGSGWDPICTRSKLSEFDG